MWFEIVSLLFLLVWTAFLFVLVGWVLVGMCHRHRDHARYRWASDRRAWIILVVLGLGLLFGTIGSYQEPSESSKAQGQFWSGKLVDAVYEGALQLFLNGDVKPDDSVFTRMARLSGLATSVLLAYEAILLLFAKPLQQLWLNRTEGHVVICGLGRVGRSVIDDLTDGNRSARSNNLIAPLKLAKALSRPANLVVIERDKDNPDISWAESRGVSVVIGNATDKEVLLSVRAERAQDVLFSIGSDEQNLESAYDLMRIVCSNSSHPSKPRMFVHLFNPRLESMLIQAKNRACSASGEKSQHHADSLVVQPFNVLDRSIQAILDGPVLDRRPGINIEERDDEVVHFVIVGFGEVGQELAVKIAQMAHYENLKRPRMTVVYSHRERDSVDQFTQLYPKFFPNILSYADELQKVGREAMRFDSWMPFSEFDDWGFGVSVHHKMIPDPQFPGKEKEVVDTEKSRGIEFAVNGGFVLSSGGTTSDDIIKKLEVLSLAKGIRPVVFICHSEGDLNCADATELRAELDLRLKLAAEKEPARYVDEKEHRVTILPFVPNRPMLSRLIEPSDKPGADLIPWGDCREICTYGALTADIYRPLATAINHDFELKSKQRYAKENGLELPTRESVPVKSLDSMIPWQRHSNLMAATHVNTKLAPLGLMLCVAGTNPPPPSNEQLKVIKDIIERSMHHDVRRDWIAETKEDKLLEVVARMEHNRWLAERLLMDWSFGHRNESGTPENKKRLAMVDWANLPDSEGVKDRDQIARILELCRDESRRPRHLCRFELCVKG